MIINISSDNICEVFIYTPQRYKYTPQRTEALTMLKEWKLHMNEGIMNEC